ncbi:RecT family recombinase [Variovorax sp. UMC13]|uniref:RecT family recombinase n=1 Tax=Variovorax sp. UMC13 TaxID=1862326 RepID=UPI0016040738|nr:RecT family recombinase [Variovorax sp. UMC13]
MNAPTRFAESSALQVVETPQAPVQTSSAALILNGDAMDRIFKFAELMANGSVTIPKHLQKNVADCLAVTMQATQWGMNPFAVAQKTHVSQGGALGYEAQLVSAVVAECGPVEGFPEYEYIGDWSKVLGKVEERKSDKGGKYYVSTYSKKDEEGLGVRCKLRLKGEKEPRVMEVFMSQCFPRFSTQWATDPKQQISYVAIRKWARQNTPGVILGVYTPDELDGLVPRDMGPAEVVKPTIPDELLTAAEAAAQRGVAAYQKFWTDTGKDNRKTLDAEHTRLKGIAAQADKDRTLDNAASTPAAPAAPVSTAAPAAAADAAVSDKPDDGLVVSYAHVMERMTKAKTPDALNEAADLIKSVTNGAQRAELQGKYDELMKEMDL